MMAWHSCTRHQANRSENIPSENQSVLLLRMSMRASRSFYCPPAAFLAAASASHWSTHVKSVSHHTTGKSVTSRGIRFLFFLIKACARPISDASGAVRHVTQLYLEVFLLNPREKKEKGMGKGKGGGQEKSSYNLLHACLDFVSFRRPLCLLLLLPLLLLLAHHARGVGVAGAVNPIEDRLLFLLLGRSPRPLSDLYEIRG